MTVDFDDLKDKATELVDKAAEVADDLADKAKDAAPGVIETVKDVAGKVGEAAASAYGTAKDFVEEKVGTDLDGDGKVGKGGTGA